MQHLDEGTIHAWLDGQLPRDEAAAAEAHVADCRPCADAVAEARGLIAASSRILMSLDSVPGEVAPRGVAPRDVALPPVPVPLPVSAPGPSGAQQRAQRRWVRGPSLAAAAMIVVAVGTFALSRAGRQEATDSIGLEAPRAAARGPAADGAAEVAANAPVQAPAPAVPAPSLGAAANEARDRGAGAQARALPSGARAEADQSAEKREEAKTLAKVAPPALADETSRLMERAVKPDSVLQRPLAAIPPASVAVGRAAPGQQRVDTATVGATRANAEREATRDRRASADAAAPVTTGSVRGRVTDGNNTGLATVMVTIVGTSTGVTTNEAGEYTLSGIQPGSHRLMARRVGFESITREVSVAAGGTTTSDLVMKPAVLSLEQVVVTGSGTTQRASVGSTSGRTPPPPPDAAPGAAVTAGQSTAVGCYELGITPVALQARLNFRRTPRRVSLDAEIVPSNADGVWYRARDLARTGAVPNGLWRPVGADGIELEWTYGTQLARIRLTGSVSQMMRGTAEEIDRSNGTGESATVVSRRASCS